VDGLRSFIQLILSLAALIWGLIKAPALFAAEKLARLFAWYKPLWVRYTHNKYDEFVYKRGLVMAAATVAAVVIIPGLVGLFLQTGYYLATHKKESIYLIQSEEIYPDDNIWAVRGCHNQNCDSESSLYYRIKPSLFHHLWSISHNGAIFLPDTIGSSVPTGLTRCEVDSYGIRMRVLMAFNIYPSILKITCEEYGPPER
jgi:hypothetical protein